MHFQYTVFGPLDEFHGFIQICYYECPHISGIYPESLLMSYEFHVKIAFQKKKNDWNTRPYSLCSLAI